MGFTFYHQEKVPSSGKEATYDMRKLSSVVLLPHGRTLHRLILKWYFMRGSECTFLTLLYTTILLIDWSQKFVGIRHQ